ncbi:hypothetical protein [Herbiconiux ginsengi]|uniref:Uncharacterized protein n=1 Tax=Herbiconiux ginsengi TaxID=381665 RepID=A0A1H3PKB5_9MICO|nr:hypothetical protein [Herbiconiux ginsengi]SDZ01632.1 hypothetical protein SAMN05216554_1945 [Herbiconiux ginsengi]
MPIEHEYSRVIHHGGRSFFATTTMSDIFIAHARDTAERGDTELVPLLHKGGVELLLIGPLTRVAVSEIEVGTASEKTPIQPAPAHPATPIMTPAARHRVAG